MRFLKTLAFLILATALVAALRAMAQQRPFTQDQISKMVQAGLGDDSGSKLIEQRGIDFAPTDAFIQILKLAGASEAFINVLSSAKPPEPASTIIVGLIAYAKDLTANGTLSLNSLSQLRGAVHRPIPHFPIYGGGA